MSSHTLGISQIHIPHTHTVHPLQMSGSHTDESSSTNADGDISNTSAESDDVSKLDIHIQRQLKHVLRLAEWAARTKQDFHP